MTDNAAQDPAEQQSDGFFLVAGQVLPPMLLLPLFVTPFDIFVSLYWFAGGIAALISFWQLLKSFFTRAAEVNRLRRLRSALTLLVFASAATYMTITSHHLERKVNAIGREVAKRIQDECIRMKQCPQAPDGWRTENQRVFLPVDFMQLAYFVTDENTRFTIRVIYRMEDELVIEGGVSNVLRETRRLH